MKSQSDCRIVTVEDSFAKTEQYLYFVIATGLENCVTPVFHPNTLIELIFHVDGVSLYRSNRNQFWPILWKKKTNAYSQFPVAIYVGSKKPSNLQLFFERFKGELKYIVKKWSNDYWNKILRWRSNVGLPTLLQGDLSSVRRDILVYNIKGKKVKGVMCFVGLDKP